MKRFFSFVFVFTCRVVGCNARRGYKVVRCLLVCVCVCVCVFVSSDNEVAFFFPRTPDDGKDSRVRLRELARLFTVHS